jgi:alkylated DNA repair dioxygenase AlkB
MFREVPPEIVPGAPHAFRASTQIVRNVHPPRALRYRHNRPRRPVTPHTGTLRPFRVRRRVGGCGRRRNRGGGALARASPAQQPRPHEDDRILRVVGIEPHREGTRNRRLARPLPHDRRLVVARALERVAQSEHRGAQHHSRSGAGETIHRPGRCRLLLEHSASVRPSRHATRSRYRDGVANVRSDARVRPSVTWQASLLTVTREQPSIDPGFAGLRRTTLSRGAWVDHVPTWVRGADDLLHDVLTRASWHQRVVTMHGRLVAEPRLHAWFGADPHDDAVSPVFGTIANALMTRYDRDFTHLGAALYRDGRDSVAWHGDRIPYEIVDPVVAIVSLGERRALRMRPKGGGASHAFVLHGGDLLVMGGTSQRTWEHSVPKTAHAGPRLSVQFRHDA